MKAVKKMRCLLFKMNISGSQKDKKPIYRDMDRAWHITERGMLKMS